MYCRAASAGSRRAANWSLASCSALLLSSASSVSQKPAPACSAAALRPCPGLNHLPLQASARTWSPSPAGDQRTWNSCVPVMDQKLASGLATVTRTLPVFLKSAGILPRVDSVTNEAFRTAALRACKAGAHGRPMCAQRVPDAHKVQAGCSVPAQRLSELPGIHRACTEGAHGLCLERLVARYSRSSLDLSPLNPLLKIASPLR